MGVECPNCGYTLVNYRTERQMAGSREVMLCWHICSRCRHVSLQHWEFTETERVPAGMAGAMNGRFGAGT